MTGADLLDVAMCRLRLPVPMAKLQVIHQLAGALKDERNGVATWQALLRWLRALRLESEVLEALAIVVAARGSTVLSSADLRAAINAPSVLSDVFMEHAFSTPVLVHSWLKCHSGEVPRFYQQPELRRELALGQIVPKALALSLQDLQQWSRRPFVAQWTFEFERLIERNDRSSDGHFSFFLPESDRGEVGQFIARRGQLARSAFLRTLALAADLWGMPIPEAQAVAMVASPADLSLLPMLPDGVPGWVRPLHGARPGTWGEAAGLATSVLRDVHEVEGKSLLHLNLPLHGDARYNGELEIVCILASGEAIDAEEVFGVHDFLPGRMCLPRTEDLTLRIDALESEATFPAKGGGRLRPVLLPLVGNNAGYLQSDLVRRMPRLPAHDSRSPLIVTPRKGGADVLLSGAKVGELLHWNWKWRPTHLKNMGGPTGVALVLDRDVTKRLLHIDSMRLCHVWRARVLTRETDYGDWREEVWQGSVLGLGPGSAMMRISS
ncbi:MAG: hypothetical protein NTX37_08860 [Burkholderiales bacterium]|nr:hypothetical protein [Burkholderiales bacterium]